MKVTLGTAGSRPTAPVAEIDPDATFAAALIDALCSWPRDNRKRGEALVMWAAQLNAVIELGFSEDMMKALISDSAQKAATIMGISVEELLVLPHAREVVAKAMNIPSDIRMLVDTELFRPGGGWRTTLGAAYDGHFGMNLAKARIAGQVAGMVVLIAATINEHHSPMVASYNRSMHVIDMLGRAGRMKLPSDRDRKNAWREWRGVGHIWAARQALVDEVAPGSVLQEPGVATRRLLGCAEWFRQFATTYRAPGSAGSLVPDFEAVQFLPSVAPIKPALVPLGRDILQVAMGYRAPTPSQ